MPAEQLRVLITNDDGYLAPGIRALAPAIAELGYDVLVVAPLLDESGVGSARAGMVGRPIRTESDVENGVTFTGIEGTPALAVTLANVGAFGQAPDLVLSGINRGHNIGVPIFHSGTVAAALTAAGQGTSAVAVSIDSEDPGHWSTAATIAGEALGWIADEPAGTVLTINVRSCEGCEITLISYLDGDMGAGWASDSHAVQNGVTPKTFAYGGEGAKNAIRGGVRSLEHGMMLDDEALKLMVEQGTYWCPTLSVYFPETEEDNTEVRRRILASHKNVFQKAMKLGVKIVFGTDVGAFEHGTSAREFVRMVEYGMKPIDAIRSATVRAAELLRLEREIGTIEAGKFADVIAVEGNPLDDIRTLSRVQFVMKAGQVYKSPR